MSEPSHAALLIIDVQQVLFEKKTPIHHADKLLQNINTLIQQAREANAPVVFIQHENASFLAKDTPGWQLHTALSPAAGDLRIHKQHGSAFQDTPLQAELDARDIKTLIVTGLVSEGCVRATCLAAHELGYHVVLVQDGHSSFHKQAAARIVEWNEKLGEKGVDVVPTQDVVF